MSICSDIFISRKEARERVRRILIHEQEKLIEHAVDGMEDFELTSYLNRESEMYFYNIEKPERKKK